MSTRFTPNVSPRPVSLSEAWLDRLGIGVMVVHGRTLIRTNAVSFSLLGLASEESSGRDLAVILHPLAPESWLAWLAAIQTDAVGAGSYALELPTRDNTGVRCLRLHAGLPEGGPSSVRYITVTEEKKEVSDSSEIAELKRSLRELLDGNPIPTIVLNAEHVVAHWNRACESTTGVRASEMVGTRNQWRPFFKRARPLMADLIINGQHLDGIRSLYGPSARCSALVPDAYEAELPFLNLLGQERWYHITAAPIRNSDGKLIGAIETIIDVTELKHAEAALLSSQVELEDLVAERTAQLETAKNKLLAENIRQKEIEKELLVRNFELSELNTKVSAANIEIQAAQRQLVQNEKLASIGQLAAGVAHEINNPIGYVQSNLGSLEKYLDDLFVLLDAYAGVTPNNTEGLENAQRLKTALDIEFLRQDIPNLLNESKEGIARVRLIVQSLKDFSRIDAGQEWQFADLHQGIDSTLNIVWNEIKYKADVVKEYGELPQIECLSSQLNQVFMNLLINAAHAIGEKRGTIRIRTGAENDKVWVEVIDNGCGMSHDTRDRIFDPFFTTKPVGIGTGLGLSLAYGIIKKHAGRIDVDSEVGVGTTFRIVLPIHHHNDETSANV